MRQLKVEPKKSGKLLDIKLFCVISNPGHTFTCNRHYLKTDSSGFSELSSVREQLSNTAGRIPENRRNSLKQ